MTAPSLRLFDAPRLSFLIFASPKSGTTWLQRLLSAHPDAVCAESRAFGDYFAANPLGQPHLTVEKYIDVLGRYYAPAVEGLRHGDQAFYRPLLFNTLDTLAETTRRATGRRVYGEKLTPYRGTARHVIDVLHDYHPGVRFVNLVRDGRDVIVSGAVQWLNMRRRQATDAEREPFDWALGAHELRDDDFEMFLDHWTDAVAAGRAALTRFEHALDVRYEAFLSSPREQAGSLFTFLGIDATPPVVEACVEAASFRALSGGREPGVEDSHSFFRKGVAGDFRQWLTAAQLARFEACAGELSRAAGYGV